MFLAIISIYVLGLEILKLIYLIFKPKFLNPVRFGPPGKLMLSAYHLVAIFFLVACILDRLGFINIQISRGAGPSVQFPDTKTIIIIVIFGSVAAFLQPYVIKFFKKRKSGK